MKMRNAEKHCYINLWESLSFFVLLLKFISSKNMVLVVVNYNSPEHNLI